MKVKFGAYPSSFENIDVGSLFVGVVGGKIHSYCLKISIDGETLLVGLSAKDSDYQFKPGLYYPSVLGGHPVLVVPDVALVPSMSVENVNLYGGRLDEAPGKILIVEKSFYLGFHSGTRGSAFVDLKTGVVVQGHLATPRVEFLAWSLVDFSDDDRPIKLFDYPHSDAPTS